MLTFRMKYVQIDANGRYRYRRGIPQHLRSFFGGKREFLKVLGTTKEEALLQYAKISTHFDEKLNAAKKLAPKGNANKALSRIELAKKLDELGISTGRPISDDEEHYRDAVAEGVLDSLERDPDTGDYVDVPEQKDTLIRALYTGIDNTNLTIADAFAYYLEVKAKKNDVERRKQLTQYKNAERILDETIGLDRPIAALSRQNARSVQTTLLQSDRAVSTVKRYLKDIRAVINFAIREHDLTCQNPFSMIELPQDGKSDRNSRISMPDPFVQKIIYDLAQRQNKDPYFVFVLLYLTGARLAEITGLKRTDVFLDSKVPHIWIRPNDMRRLKNDWSERQVPLCSTLQGFVREAVAQSEHEYLFARYIEGRGADRASSWLMKVIRNYIKDKKVTLHSLRHNFRDRIRLQRIPMERGKALEGHRLSLGEEANYGTTSEEWLAKLSEDIQLINKKNILKQSLKSQTSFGF
jgi:integrase